MVMHAGNGGGSRTSQGLLGRRQEWGIGPPRSRCPKRILEWDSNALYAAISGRGGTRVLRHSRRKDALPKLAAMSVEYRTESQHISARVTF